MRAYQANTYKEYLELLLPPCVMIHPGGSQLAALDTSLYFQTNSDVALQRFWLTKAQQ